jgi:dienelactone hydrolase
LLTTAALLLDLGGWTSFPRPYLPSAAAGTFAETLTIPTRHGPVIARLDRPVPSSPRTLVVFPGIHAAGLDEPRLTRFSTRIAATGLNVLSVPLPDLRAFRITGRSTDVAEDVTAWASSQPALAPAGRVSVAGVSFAGGLAIVAAGRPSLAGRLDAVVSLGGHGDLGHVLEFLCTGVLPDGTRVRPHEYSVAVVALAAVPYLVPPAEVEDLERLITMYLTASTDDTAAFRRGRAILDEVQTRLASAPPASARVMRWMLDRDIVSAGRAIEPFIDELTRDPSLSPERSPAPGAPVFLLQGRDDNVIPASETPRLARYLEAQGTPRVRWLLTPILSHVGIDTTPPPVELWKLIRFWRALEGALR